MPRAIVRFETVEDWDEFLSVMEEAEQEGKFQDAFSIQLADQAVNLPKVEAER